MDTLDLFRHTPILSHLGPHLPAKHQSINQPYHTTTFSPYINIDITTLSYPISTASEHQPSPSTNTNNSNHQQTNFSTTQAQRILVSQHAFISSAEIPLLSLTRVHGVNGANNFNNLLLFLRLARLLGSSLSSVEFLCNDTQYFLFYFLLSGILEGYLRREKCLFLLLLFLSVVFSVFGFGLFPS
jgi:hypothetical protein